MNKAIDIGLLIIRVGIGGSLFAFRALGNLAGGSDLWAQNGAFIFETGLNLSPELVGLSFAVLECVGALMLITGALFRTGTVLLLVTVLPTLLYQVNSVSGTAYSGLESAFVSIVLVSVFVGLFVSGPGSIAMHPFRSTQKPDRDDSMATFESLS